MHPANRIPYVNSSLFIEPIRDSASASAYVQSVVGSIPFC